MITLLIGQHQFRVFWQSVFAGIGLLAGASSVGLPSGFVSKKRRLQREVKCGSSEDDLDCTSFQKEDKDTPQSFTSSYSTSRNDLGKAPRRDTGAR
jgi:hypothetical protein